MKVSVIQMVSGRDVDENLRQAEGLIIEAISQGAKAVLLPENFAVFSSKAILSNAQQAGKRDHIRSFLRATALRYQIFIIAGSVPVIDESLSGKAVEQGKAFTSCLVYDPAGREVARYDKLHLFDVDVNDAHGSYRESDTFSAGDQAVVMPMGDFTLGLSICYDLRFPELYRKLTEQGANLFVVPAAFTYKTGQAHWLPLLQARAIENQAYVLAANQGGEHGPTRKTWGHSCIIDPWGKVIGELEQGVGVMTAELDLQLLDDIRKQMPVWSHRKIN